VTSAGGFGRAAVIRGRQPGGKRGRERRAPAGCAVDLEDAAGGTDAPVTLAPASYNLGVAVGWRRFAVAGDVSSTKGDPALGQRENPRLGVSYSLNKKLTAKAAVGAERGDPRKSSAIRGTDNVSVDVGGALSLSKRVALTGGVRYRIDSDRLSTLNDHRRDSQAVYIGTAFKF
jgi:hypothetical protein